MIDACRIIELPRFADARGSLGVIEAGVHTSFAIKRVYYLYDVPSGQKRGSHAHLALHQLIVAMSGSVEVVLDDGRQKQRFRLERPDQGLYICPMIWRRLENFSLAAVCVVLASEHFQEDDYIHDYADFVLRASAQHAEP